MFFLFPYLYLSFNGFLYFISSYFFLISLSCSKSFFCYPRTVCWFNSSPNFPQLCFFASRTTIFGFSLYFLYTDLSSVCVLSYVFHASFVCLISACTSQFHHSLPCSDVIFHMPNFKSRFSLFFFCFGSCLVRLWWSSSYFWFVCFRYFFNCFLAPLSCSLWNFSSHCYSFPVIICALRSLAICLCSFFHLIHLYLLFHS